MSSYDEQYERAVAAESTEAQNVQIIKWEEDGQRVVGRFVSQGLLPDSKFGNEVQRYFVDTDRGRVSCVLGGAADADLMGKLKAGQLVAFTFHGKKALGDGREVNMFQIDVFPESDPDGEAQPKEADKGQVCEHEERTPESEQGSGNGGDALGGKAPEGDPTY